MKTPEVLPPESENQLEKLRLLSKLLDSKFSIPGTNIKFGLDPLLGFIPVIGDALGTLISSYIVLTAAKLGASRLTLARMIVNVALESIMGVIPILGDIFDLVWRANDRNLALLERSKLSFSGSGDKRLKETIFILVVSLFTMILLTVVLAIYLITLFF